MADVTQAAITLIAHTSMTNAATRAGLNAVGADQDIRTYISGMVYVYHAIVEAAANDPGIDYILQGRWSTGATSDEDWIDLWTFTTGTTAAVAAVIQTTEAAAETTIGVESDPTAAFTPGTLVYIDDATATADGEWNRVAISEAGSPPVVTIVDGLTNAKAASDNIWTQAELFVGSVDLSGMSYVRMVVQGSDTTGANTHFKAHMVAFTDFV